MKTVLLKLSGEFVAPQHKKHLLNIIKQIKQLQKNHRFAIVIGGGNIFRARKEGNEFKLTQQTADNIGMLATVMNGLVLQEYFLQNEIPTSCLSAIAIPSLVKCISQETITQALNEKKCIIFAGGTGNPFFTTDTNAVLRALQINANEIWKATTIDAIYDDDPTKNPQAKPLKKITYTDTIKKQLHFMDLTAITLAQQHALKIRVFNAFSENALLNVARNIKFGSTVSE
jgi:uridylate kinase